MEVSAKKKKKKKKKTCNNKGVHRFELTPPSSNLRTPSLFLSFCLFGYLLLVYFHVGPPIFLFISNPPLNFSKQSPKIPIFTSLPILTPTQKMAHFLVLLFVFFSCSSALNPPSPGFSPSNQVQSIGFDHGFRNRWGSQHQKVDHGALTIWLDSSSGIHDNLST